jgi:hypothetical protein
MAAVNNKFPEYVSVVDENPYELSRPTSKYKPRIGIHKRYESQDVNMPS